MKLLRLIAIKKINRLTALVNNKHYPHCCNPFVQIYMFILSEKRGGILWS